MKRGVVILALGLSVSFSAPGAPDNDDFTNGPALPGCEGPLTATNFGASKEVGEPYHAEDDGGASVWWTWTQSVPGDVTLDTHGSDFDTLLAVYTGTSVDALSLVASNDDDGSPNYNSGLVFSAEGDVTYHIAVDGYDSGSGPATGIITLNWSLSIPCNETYSFERMWPSDPRAWASRAQSVIGIAVDDNDYVYAADFVGCLVQKYDEQGIPLIHWGSTGNGPEDFGFPLAVAVDQLGNTYVADIGERAVLKFNKFYNFERRLGEGLLTYPQGVAVDLMGNVYVSDSLNHRVYKFDFLGTLIDEWGSEGAGEDQFQAPVGIATDRTGNVYVADTGNNRIQKFSGNGDPITRWGTLGSTAGKFDSPVSVAVDRDGYVYVTDQGNSRIQKFRWDATSQQYIFDTQWGSAGRNEGEFDRPYSLSLDSSGDVYVSEVSDDVSHYRIQKFSSNGAFIGVWPVSKKRQGFFSDPEAVAIDSAGDLYVADSDNARIQKFDVNGLFITQWGTHGTDLGEFDSPAGVAVSDSGYVYVSDTGNDRIQRFQWNPTASRYEWDLEWMCNRPSDIEVDATGFVYAVVNGCVRRYDADGQNAVLVSCGPCDFDFGSCCVAFSVAIDSADYVYVGYRDALSYSCYEEPVQKFQWNSSTQTFDAVACQYNTSDSGYLAFDDLDNLYQLRDEGVWKYGADGQPEGNWLNEAPGGVQDPARLEMGSDGSMYIADKGLDRVLKLTPATMCSYDKAIIIAGRKSPDDILWPATQKCTSDAYTALRHRGFGSNMIAYLSHSSVDADGDGQVDSVLIDDPAMWEPYLDYVFGPWASLGEGLVVKDVVVYLADHGGKEGHFYIDEDVFLTASASEPDDLDNWLDTVEENIEGKVTVVLEACYSGDFLTQLAKAGRTVISSTDTDELAYFLGMGSTSFSGFFWQQVMHGSDLNGCFTYAQDEVGHSGLPQTPQVDVDGIGGSNQPADLDGLLESYIGRGVQYEVSYPELGDTHVVVPENMGTSGTSGTPAYLSEGNTATLLAQHVTDVDGQVVRVFATIEPPGLTLMNWDSPLLGLPEESLEPIGGDDYSFEYNEFSKAGRYRITFYAQDNFLYRSEPSVVLVDVGSPLRRRAVLVAGGSADHQQWNAYAHGYARAYEALSTQLYDDDEIFILAHTKVVPTSEPVNAPTLAALEGSGSGTLSSFVGTDTKDLTLYFVGPGCDGLFQLNEDEDLSASALDALLDTLQPSISGTITVVYDACSASSFSGTIGGSGRIVVTSTGEGESARFIEVEGGVASFSEYFWDRVKMGNTVGAAYTQARIDMSDHDQHPELHDTDNVAYDYYIGHGLVLGSDEPIIESITDDTILNPDLQTTDTELALSASGVYSPGRNIEQVWAVITPPRYAENSDCFSVLPRVYLNGAGKGPYTNSYERFTAYGDYVVKFYCTDSDGNTSKPKTCIVTQARDDLGDMIKPTVSGFSPANGAEGVSPYPVIEFTATDTGSGVDINSISLSVNGVDVSRESVIWGSPGSYNLRYRSPDPFAFSSVESASVVSAVVSVSDLDGNVQGPLTYEFTITDGVDGDGDGLPDDWAAYYGVSDPAAHSDSDGYTDGQEAERGTDPQVDDAIPGGPDAYENDDRYQDARWISINGTKQYHTFHDWHDADWVRFYAQAGWLLTVQTSELGADSDTSLAIYGGGNYTTPLKTEDNPNQPDDPPEDWPAVITNWQVPATPGSGYYYVKVTNENACEDLYGVNASYALEARHFTGTSRVTAVAGLDQTVKLGTTVELDGSGSHDLLNLPSKKPEAYRWTWPSAPGGTLSNAATAIAEFDANTVGEFRANLRAFDDVNADPDNSNYSDDDVTINVTDGVVHVDFTPPEPFNPDTTDGTSERPFLDVWRAVDKVLGNGIIEIDQGETAEQPITLGSSKHYWVKAPNGTVRLGVAGSKMAVRRQPMPRKTTAVDDMVPATELLQAFGISGADSAPGSRVWHDRTTYEPVIPYSQTADGHQAARVDSALAVRLRSDADIDPESIWGPAPGYTEGQATAQWQPAVEGDHRDIWVVFRPEESWYLEDVVELSAGAETVTGEVVEPVTHWFQIESDVAREPKPETATAEDEEPEASVTEATDTDASLPDGIDSPQTIEPEEVYAVPHRVWLPLPMGLHPADVQVYYYRASGDDQGWYPAENVEGWLVPDSYLHLRLEGTNYLGFLVRHAGIVQLGTAE